LAPLRDEGLLEVELKGESSQDNEGTGEATHYTLGDIKGEKVASYRDTTGVDRATFERILQQCSRATLAGKRDYALLRLLWGNALRRNEISQLSVCDFDPASKTLQILGKGRGTSVGSSGLGRGDCSGDRRLVGRKGKFLAR
jgi:integrase